MKEIKSRSNPEIKRIALLHTKKQRDALQLFLGEGYRVCKTLIGNGAQLETLYVSEKMVPNARALAPESKITVVHEGVVDKLTSATTPSGMIGVFHIPKPQDTLTPGLVLAKLSDPGNVGTLIRTAVAMNIRTVVCVETVDPYSPKVVQASAGTIGAVAIMQLSWEQLMKRKHTLQLCALIVSGGKKPSEIQEKNILLVIGSEAHGLPNEWFHACDTTMTIEMPGNAESLNAAVA